MLKAANKIIQINMFIKNFSLFSLTILNIKLTLKNEDIFKFVPNAIVAAVKTGINTNNDKIKHIRVDTDKSTVKSDCEKIDIITTVIVVRIR